MINPAKLDLSKLPFIPLSKKSNLPSIPGVYLCVDGNDIVQYIGKS